MYRLVIHHRAARYLRRLPEEQQTRLKRMLEQLQNDPVNSPGLRKMVGDWQGYHRVRVGNFRVIFWIDEDEQVVYVDHMGPRGDIYK
ncbi:MAG: type II toxin-antitoxin system RelE/ParE family toxin [Rhodothermales bacterium]